MRIQIFIVMFLVTFLLVGCATDNTQIEENNITHQINSNQNYIENTSLDKSIVARVAVQTVEKETRNILIRILIWVFSALWSVIVWIFTLLWALIIWIWGLIAFSLAWVWAIPSVPYIVIFIMIIGIPSFLGGF